jgi:hypothetical protein
MKVRVVEDDECCPNSYPDLLVIRGQFRKSRAALCGGSPLIRHQRANRTRPWTPTLRNSIFPSSKS